MTLRLALKETLCCHSINTTEKHLVHTIFYIINLTRVSVVGPLSKKYNNIMKGVHVNDKKIY